MGISRIREIDVRWRLTRPYELIWNDTLSQVCLVFTDGIATDRSKVPAASKAWADDGVTVFAIGIGKGMEGTAGHQGLKDIAGDEERAFSVENFEAIGEMAKSLLKKVCTKVGKSLIKKSLHNSG